MRMTTFAQYELGASVIAAVAAIVFAGVSTVAVPAVPYVAGPGSASVMLNCKLGRANRTVMSTAFPFVTSYWNRGAM